MEVLEECGALETVWPNRLLEQWSDLSIREKIIADLAKVVPSYSALDKRLAIFLKRLHPNQIKDWSMRLKVPNELTDFCLVVADFEANCAESLDPQVVLNTFNRADVWRKLGRFLEVLQLARTVGHDTQAWQRALDGVIQVDGGKIAADIAKQSSSANPGEQIHHALARARLKAITEALH
jgi:hypothetical protein